MKITIRGAVGAALLALLSACGGGGGGGDGAVSPGSGASSADQAAAPVPAAGDAASILLTGRVTYDYVPNIRGKLDYNATQPRPIRGATLEILDEQGQTVLTETQTDTQGRYAISIPRGRQVRVQVIAELKSPRGHVTVRDNTQGGGAWALQTNAIGSDSGTVDVHAPSGWTEAAYRRPRAAAPFAILDTVYTAQAKVFEAAPQAVLPELVLYWSPSNKPAPGNAALGEITASHFRQYQQPASIYILGQADVDTDEYDESVVAHEWGHFYQSVFSRDDTLGGSHEGDPLEMTVAFSEGWGNGWQGIALGRSDYADSYGAGQASAAVVMPLTTGDPKLPGWFSERSIAHILWKLAQDVGFAPIHRAMVSMRQSPAFTSIHAFGYSLRQQDPGAADRLDALLTSQKIVTSATSGDPFGTHETNDAGLGALVPADTTQLGMPVYLPLSMQDPGSDQFQWKQMCSANLFGDDNALGVHRAGRIDVPRAGTYRLYVATADGGRPYVTLLAGGERVFSLFAGSSGAIDLQLPQGTTVFTVADDRAINSQILKGCLAVAFYPVS